MLPSARRAGWPASLQKRPLLASIRCSDTKPKPAWSPVRALRKRSRGPVNLGVCTDWGTTSCRGDLGIRKRLPRLPHQLTLHYMYKYCLMLISPSERGPWLGPSLTAPLSLSLSCRDTPDSGNKVAALRIHTCLWGVFSGWMGLTGLKRAMVADKPTSPNNHPYLPTTPASN